LIRRPDGGTHLEGRTWYELTAATTIYWRVWSDAIIQRIHQRVLAHVRRLSEADGRAAGSRRRVPLATPEECASGAGPQRAVSGPDSARRCIPRLAPATGVLKGRADENPPRFSN
jgi:hypothetical protein